MTSETSREIFIRLRNDPRLKKIIDDIKLRSGDDIFLEIVRYFAHIPELWNALKGESSKTKKLRRQIVAKKLRSIATFLEKDPDAKWIRIEDHKSVIATPIRDDEHPTLPNFLIDIAEMFDTWAESPMPFEGYETGRMTTRMGLREFTKREVWVILQNFPLNKKSPNKEAAEIVNIILMLSKEKMVKAADIANMAKPEV